VILLLAFLFLKTQSLDYAEHYKFINNLSRINELHSSVDQDTLKLRYDLLSHYDSLSNELLELKKIYKDLREIPTFISKNGKIEINKSIDANIELLSKKEQLTERFKSQNAILRNSLYNFPRMATKLVEEAPSRTIGLELATLIHDLLPDVLLYNLTSSKELAPKIQWQISRLLRVKGQYAAADGNANRVHYVILRGRHLEDSIVVGWQEKRALQPTSGGAPDGHGSRDLL